MIDTRVDHALFLPPSTQIIRGPRDSLTSTPLRLRSDIAAEILSDGDLQHPHVAENNLIS